MDADVECFLLDDVRENAALLQLEVAVDRARRDVRGVGDLLDGGRIEALRVAQLQPYLDDPQRLLSFTAAMAELRSEKLLLQRPVSVHRG